MFALFPLELAVAHPPLRPCMLDDARLRALVEQPPATRASILGTLLSLCLAGAIRRAHVAMAARCIVEPPPELGAGALEELLSVLAENEARYELRARLAGLELAGLLAGDDPAVGLEHALDGGGRLLLEYARLLDEPLHEQLAALVARPAAVRPQGVEEAWCELLDLRQIDACVGLLLARASMLDPRPRPRALGPVDARDPDAVGSLAWWCRWFLDAWDDDYPLGKRLAEEEIEPFVSSARLSLGELDAGLLAALVRVFPAIGA